MIQRNNNLSVLPFYENVDEQNHRRPYAYGEVYPLYTPLGCVPPFQIIIPHTTATIQSVMLRHVEETTWFHIKSQLDATGLKKQYFGDYDVISYPSLVPYNLTSQEGRYEMKVVLSDHREFYSDYFTVVADVSGMIQLQWYDEQDLVMDGSRIVYVDASNQDGGQYYKNTLWLPTLLGKPEYEFTEDGEERDGYFFPEKMISEKRYKCTFLAPEYLCDVMRFIRMSDVVLVRDNYNNLYRCDTFLITPKWQEQGDLASVELEFTCDTVAKKVGRGIIRGNLGDFNDDYNNDFDITINN